MSKFVADFYQQKVKQLKIAAAKTLMTNPGEVKASKGKGGAQHPATDRDSDDEAEEKNKLVEIVNEVEGEAEGGQDVVKDVSAENKAAAALDKVFTQENESEQKEMDTE